MQVTDNEAIIAAIQLLMSDLPPVEQVIILSAALPSVDAYTMETIRATLVNISSARDTASEIKKIAYGSSGIGALGAQGINTMADRIGTLLGAIRANLLR